jgi:transposase-like protein
VIWPQVVAAEPCEQANRDTNRRAGVIGIFTSDDARIRAVGALMPETNHE